MERIHGFELNPLLVTVFAATTDYSKQDIPANITELFKKFTELMLGRWDEGKGLELQYQAPLKDFILQKIAFKMHEKNITSIERNIAESIAIYELSEKGHEINGLDLLNEIFDRSGLFRIQGNSIEFRHHLLQEFFAGRGIENPNNIKNIIADEWWKRAIVFYFGENPKNISLLQEATKSIVNHSSAKMIDAASTVGLALQACYLSSVAEKIEVWKWTVNTLGDNHKLIAIEQDPENKYPLAYFFSVYLYARDSVASYHIKQNLKPLIAWAKEIQSQNDERLFWLIVSLIESGDLDQAELVMKSVSPKSQEQLLAIFLGCNLAKEVRPLMSNQKAHAKSICDKLAPKIQPYAQQLLHEYGTLLLEYKAGKTIDAIK